MALPLRTSAPPAAAAGGQDRAAAPAAASEAVDNTAAAAAAVLPEVEDSESSTIYVKNLAFATGVLLLMQQSSLKLNLCFDATCALMLALGCRAAYASFQSRLPCVLVTALVCNFTALLTGL